MDQLQKQRESESNITEIPGNETIAPTKCEKERQPRQDENKPRRPWLNVDDSYMSEEQLKAASKEWDYGTWQEYLESLEVRQKEFLFEEPRVIENVSEEICGEAIFSYLKEDRYPNLSRSIRLHLNFLSPLERLVLEKYFWEGQSKEEIAQEFRVSSATVRVLFRRGLKKIKAMLLSGKIQAGVSLSSMLERAR